MESLHPGVLRAVILALAVFLPVAKCDKVIVGDPFTFHVKCKPGESGTLVGVFKTPVLGHGTSQVATYQNGEWRVTADYSDRMIATTSGLVFTQTQCTDGGTYELICSGREEKPRVQLEVVVATEKFVTEGEAAILPCYSAAGRAGISFWMKDNRVLCNSSSDAGCSGTSPERRYGNLSLILKNARPEDSGDYFCYSQDQHDNQSGTPAAVRLTVMKKPQPPPNASTAAPGNVSGQETPG